MMTPMLYIPLLTAAISMLSAHVMFRSVFRSRRALLEQGGLAGETDLRAPVHSISIVIPLRNEEKSLPGLLADLQKQQAIESVLIDPSVVPVDIILVDDESEDDTVQVAQSYGMRVIRTAPRPEGWLGKTWACWTGAQAAQGSHLLFLDADVRLAPHALRSLVDSFRRHPVAQVLSVQPWHNIKTPYESLSSMFNLQVLLGLSGRRKCCFGPCILCERTAYDRIGGHRSVSDRVVEDIELGDRFCRAGIAVASKLGRDEIQFRMYPEGVVSLMNGWTKNILPGSRLMSGGTRALDTVWIVSLMAMPLVIAFSLLFPAIFPAVFPAVFPTLSPIAAGQSWLRPVTLAIGILSYLLPGLQFHALLRRAGSFPLWTSLAYPVMAWFFSFVFLRALCYNWSGHRIGWKGRSVSPGGG